MMLQCKRALNKLGTGRLQQWATFSAELAQQTRHMMYVLPDLKPKFLGIIFSRVGYPGSVHPHASYCELGNIHYETSQVPLSAVSTR